MMIKHGFYSSSNDLTQLRAKLIQHLLPMFTSAKHKSSLYMS